MSIPKIAAYQTPSAQEWPTSTRVDWRIDASRAVLLIHDMQDYFVDFFDRAAAPVPELLACIASLRQACRSAGVPVVYTAQPAEQSREDRGLLQDWWGPGITVAPEKAGVVEALMPEGGDTVMTKWRYSAFARSDLQTRMKALGRDQLIVCGVYAHIGVMTTCVDAFMHDIQPFLVADAVADFSRHEHLTALNWVSGRCGVVIATDAVVQALAPIAAPAHGQPVPHADVQTLLREVAAMIEMPASDLHLDDNLIDMGLDSIRLMSLVTRWRQQGLSPEFTRLAERPAIRDWWDMLYTDPSSAKGA